MTEYPNSGIQNRRFLSYSAAATIFVSLLVLAGWALNVEFLKSILSGFPQMKPITAVTFVVMGLGLLFAVYSENRVASALKNAVGLSVIAVALATLSTYILGPEFLGDVLGGVRNRMSPHAATAFVFAGISLVLLRPDGKFGRQSAISGLLALATVYAAILGLLYHATQFYGVSPVNGMAVHSAFLFLVISIGLLSANSRCELVGIFLADSLGGQTARRLLPFVVLVPTLFGWLRVKGQDLGLYDTWFGLAMTIFVSVTSMFAMIVFYSRSLHKADENRRRAEAELAEKEKRYRELFDYSQGLICIHDMDGVLKTVNPAAVRMLGYSENELVGKNLSELVPAERRPYYDAYLRQVTHEGLASGLLELDSKSGKRVILRYHNILASEDGKESYVLGHAQDVTELIEAQAQLKNLSLTDDLTGLYNRRGFLALAEQQLKLEMHKGTARGLTLFFVDMDGLKSINDTYGHEAGSDAIVDLARLIKSVLRSADLFARWGGDEFVILTIGLKDENSQMMVDRINERLNDHNIESDKPYKIACSIGLAPIDFHVSRSFEEIIAEADKAMYADKLRRKANRGNEGIPPNMVNLRDAENPQSV